MVKQKKGKETSIEEDVNELFSSAVVPSLDIPGLQIHDSKEDFLTCQRTDNKRIKRGTKKYQHLLVLRHSDNSSGFSEWQKMPSMQKSIFFAWT